MPETDRPRESLSIVILGLSITSSWGNGHATAFRSLTRGLAARGHRVLFLERDMPWCAGNRDMPQPPHCRAELYFSLQELQDRFADEVRGADFVIVGSSVPQGVEVGRWVTRCARACAFYDLDTPATLAKLAAGGCEYLQPSLVPRYDAYFSCTGGAVPRRIEEQFGSPMARTLYGSVDEEIFRPVECRLEHDLGYLGTYCEDRQEKLDRMLLGAARAWPSGQFVIAGPKYPPMTLPLNVQRAEHIPPDRQAEFYCSQAFTLSLTRADMAHAGHSPGARLFEAAACGVPIISDAWEGLDTFLTPGKEVFVAESAADVLHCLQKLRSATRKEVGAAARQRVLQNHTSRHRAAELEEHIQAVLDRKVRRGAARRRNAITVIASETPVEAASLTGRRETT